MINDILTRKTLYTFNLIIQKCHYNCVESFICILYTFFPKPSNNCTSFQTKREIKDNKLAVGGEFQVSYLYQQNYMKLKKKKTSVHITNDFVISVVAHEPS